MLFGITGDLAQRKLLPALYRLFKDNLIHEDTILLGISRRDVSAEELLGQVELCVNASEAERTNAQPGNICDPAVIAKVRAALRMHQMSLTDGAEYDELLAMLNNMEAEAGVCMDRLYYLSIPPQMFEPIVRNLGQHGLGGSCQHDQAHTRLLIEKPFGYDLRSATELIAETAEWFDEAQTFRVDHYVAKNAVVDLLEFRMSHPETSVVWNAAHLKRVTITAFEQIDIEGRAVFYDAIGALRDIIQSHLLQVMAIALMPLPDSGTAADIHNSRLQLLKSVMPIPADKVPEQTVRAQYDGYADEVKRADSFTETYAELTLGIASDTWQGVPVRLRTGKAMSSKSTEIRLEFEEGVTVFCHIQPDTGLELSIDGRPADGIVADTLRTAVKAFNHTLDGPARVSYADAYERIIVEASAGQREHFTTAEEVLAAWRIVENVVEAWSKNDNGLIHYGKGSESVRKE